MAPKKSTGTKRKERATKASSNLVSALSVVGLVALAVADLASSNDVPNIIYIGLIGSALGAKIDDIFNLAGGGKR